MLAALRKNSKNAIIYVLFGIIIAVFIINFGPGSKGCEPGSVSGGHAYAARVGGSTLTEQDFRFAYIALGGSQVSSSQARDRRLKEFVMDKLIERELLAQEAERLGFDVSAKEVEDMIADGRMFVLGVPRKVDAYVYKDGKFDYERFKMVSQNQLGVSVMRFIDIERRELLADKVRELLKVGTKVSPDEVKTDFEQKGTQVNLQYVRYSARRFDDGGEPTAAEIDGYVKDHQDELKKLYEERAFQYKKLDKQAKLRHVSVDVAKDAPKSQQDEAKKKIDEAAAKLKAGKPWSEVAKQYSSDQFNNKRGGLQGWRKKGFAGYPPAIEDKIFAAKKGELIGPERTDRGFELVQVDDFREGDVPFEVAAREIAEEKLMGERAKLKAKAEAEALAAKLKAGGKLEDLVPKETVDTTGQDPQVAALMKKLSDTPKLNETELFPRKGNSIPEIGVSKELSKKAFEMKVGETAGPFEVGGAYVVVKVKDHKDPDMGDFEKRKNDIVREYERSKWAEVLDGWSKQRCTEVRDDGRLRVNDDVLFYEQQQPPGAPKSDKPKYEPCVGTRLF